MLDIVITYKLLIIYVHSIGVLDYSSVGYVVFAHSPLPNEHGSLEVGYRNKSILKCII